MFGNFASAKDDFVKAVAVISNGFLLSGNSQAQRRILVVVGIMLVGVN
jgi:hypothetical protein